MATVSFIEHMLISGLDAPDKTYGSLTVPKTLTVTGTVFEAEFTVADNFGEVVAWTTGNGGITTADVIRIETDATVWVEFRNTLSGGAEFIRLEVTPEQSLILGSDNIGGGTSSLFDGAVLVDDTDFAQIDRIEFHRDVADGVGDATVQLTLID